MAKKVVLAIIIVIALVVLIAGVKALQIKAMIDGGAAMMANMPPTTVSSAKVQSGEWEVIVPAVGTVTAVHGVTLSVELSGTVQKINFESGTSVKQGDLLVQLDVTSEEAQLRSAEAQAELTRIEVERAQTLRKTNAIAASEFDTAETKSTQAKAEVDSIRATIAKKTIRAPFDGRLGIRQVNLGQFVNVATPIVTIQSMTPIYVDFSLPQQEIGSIKNGMKIRAIVDSFEGEKFEGSLTAIGSDLDKTTRSIMLQATLDNPEGKLRPGMFARVELVQPKLSKVLYVPATAIIHEAYQDAVFVIEANEKGDGKVIRQQLIRLGVARGDFVQVTEGLKEGDEVVSSGVFKLRNQSPVVVDNTHAPKPELAPTPAEG